ncbi:hypothetical protein V8E52_010939 [Russula decolorans]
MASHLVGQVTCAGSSFWIISIGEWLGRFCDSDRCSSFARALEGNVLGRTGGVPMLSQSLRWRSPSQGSLCASPGYVLWSRLFFFFFTRLGVVGVFHSVSELSRQQADPSSSRQTCRKLTSDKRDFRLLIAYRAALDHYVIIVICLSSLGSVSVVWLVVCLGVILITGCVVGAINIPIATPSCAVSRDASGCMDVWSWSSTHFF